MNVPKEDIGPLIGAACAVAYLVGAILDWSWWIAYAVRTCNPEGTDPCGGFMAGGFFVALIWPVHLLSRIWQWWLA